MGTKKRENGASLADSRVLKVRGVRKKDIDEDKIALAYVMLAKAIVSGASSEQIDEAIIQRRHEQLPSADAPTGEGQ